MVAVYGAWGDGKTTVLNFIRHELAHSADVVPLPFNPWRFPDESVLLHQFFEALAVALGKALPTKRKQVLSAIAEFSSWLPLGVSVGGVGLSMDSITRKLESKGAMDLDEAKQRLGALLDACGKRVVVFMDDLDRLEPPEIHAVLRLVKLTADFPHTTYLIACDDLMVARAMGLRFGGDEVAGRQFLEKIVQVPLHLPQSEPESLARLCLEGVEIVLRRAGSPLDDHASRDFGRRFAMGLAPALTTPRVAKRYVNALEFALPLMFGEVNTEDLMLIEGIRVVAPILYEFIRANRYLLLGIGQGQMSGDDRKRAGQLIEETLKLAMPDHPGAARDLLGELFPTVGGLLGNMHYGPEWQEQWTSQKRICSDQYFKRFFLYGIPADDIPDKMVEDLLARAGQRTPEEGAALLGRTLTEANGDRLLSKMSERIESVSPSALPTVVRALALAGARFPQSASLADAGGPFVRAALLVRKLVMRLPPGNERYDLAIDLVTNRADLAFAAECFRWLRIDTNRPPEYSALSSQETQQLGETLARRIAAAAESTRIWESARFPFVLWIWAQYTSRQEVSAALGPLLGREPGIAVELLRTFATRGEEIESGRETAAELPREHYANIARSIDVDLLVNALRSVYGAALDQSATGPTSVGAWEREDLDLATQLTEFSKQVQKAAQPHADPKEAAKGPAQP